MKLFYKTLGEGDPLFILHGLFGSSDNWYTLAKRFAEDYKVFAIDLRNHGKSPHSDENTYDLMADDLLEIVYEEQLTYLNIIGHSMGGKVAMKFAEKHGSFIDKMVVADIGPKKYEAHHDLVLKALNAFIKSDINTRKEAEKLILNIVKDEGVALFLSKNLYWKNPGELRWKMNVPVLERSMDQILRQVPNKLVDVETLFLRGSNSDYILESDESLIKSLFPNSEIQTVQNAGHWLHAEQPDDFYDKCLFFFDR